MNATLAGESDVARAFAAGYAARTAAQYADPAAVEAAILSRYVALPCRCGESNCKGWAMVPNTPADIATHQELYS